MAPPIYFFAGKKPADLLAGAKVRPEFLAEVGMGEVWADVKQKGQVCVFDATRKTPGDKPGLFVCALGRGGKIPTRLGYHPDDQTWTKVREGVWLGVDKHEPPGPEDIERTSILKGDAVTIDGKGWIAPVIRRTNGSTALPCRVGKGIDGAFTAVLKEEYRAIWEAMDDACGLFVGDRPNMTVFAATDLAIRGLSLNYRFGWAEQTAFGPLDSSNWETILAEMIDLKWTLTAINDAKKKLDASTVGA